jgi:hypothetical protein
MKQHITALQFEESTEGQKNLFIKLTSGDSYLPDIGQMIEFLGDDWYQECSIGQKITGDYVLPDNNNLCNMLWEAVKHKLKT